MKSQSLIVALVLAPALGSAQVPDSAKRLPDIPVTVTRTSTPLSHLGAAVTVLDSAALHRNRLAPSLDDALAFVPGVVIGNRWNYSLDQRLSIRGFGARANFGWRGIKVLIDGVPQTLPDGQSQLNHLDLATVNRIEVLRGAASAEYGNAAGGVIAFTTAGPAEHTRMAAGVEYGDFNSMRMQFSGSVHLGPTSNTLSLSRFVTDGSRQHSGAEQRRLVAGTQFGVGSSGIVGFRVSFADDPTADNPGALTAAEIGVNRDSAAATNIRRNAGKALKQTQLALSYQGRLGCQALTASTWRLTRELDNPLAAPPPAPASPTEGTWVGIDRLAGGARLATTCSRGTTTLSLGADAQSMRDDRVNRRSLAGVPGTVLLLDQQERVTEVGPFLHVEWRTTPKLSVGGGARWDAVRFSVDDHLQPTSGSSGSRDMSAGSGSLRISYAASAGISLWSSLATAFETPTTTELANQPSGQTGLNQSLDPQRSLTGEVGARGRHGALTWEVAGWQTTTRSAIVPAQDQGGRSYFQNAGRSRTSGIETSLRWRAVPRVELLATATILRATFLNYFSVIDQLTLDGNHLAGLPGESGRIGLVGDLGHGMRLDIDQTLRGKFFADDRNLLGVDDLGAGITGIRFSWHGRVARSGLTVFGTAMNIFDKAFVGSVTINGAAGRTFEPAAGRVLSIGLQLGS